MADRGGSNSFSWFVIGFLAGVAATLAVLIWFGARSPRREAAAPAPAAAMPRATRKAELKPLPRKEDAIPASALPAPDEQVVEDAAAAGMTSRSKNRPGR